MRSALLQVGCHTPRKGYSEHCGFAIHHWCSGILDHPLSRVMTAMSVVLMLALEPADMLLGVKLESDPPDHIELGFEEVDVVLLVLHQALEQIARDVILDAVAVGRRFLIKATGAHLGGEVALDDFLDVLADPQGIEHLHVGKPVEEQDAIGEAVGVVHLLDGFLAPLLGQLQQTPIVQHPIMQPILVDGGELAAQTLVEIFDDSCVALHDALSLPGPIKLGPRKVIWNATKSLQAEQSYAERASRGSQRYSRFQATASSGNAPSTFKSVSVWLCGHPEWQALAQAPRASSMMVLMVRAHRPHSALQPRQP